MISIRVDDTTANWLKQRNASKTVEGMVINATKEIKKFAEAAADAYINQYIIGQGVMGQPVVYYNRTNKTYGWCSKMTPLSEDEVAVEWLEEGIYGETGDDPSLARQLIVDYLVSETDWRDLFDKISPEE